MLQLCIVGASDRCIIRQFGTCVWYMLLLFPNTLTCCCQCVLTAEALAALNAFSTHFPNLLETETSNR